MADEKTTEPKKDNNKRLALLEGGVASLAAVLGELGVKIGEKDDPIVLVIDLAKGQAAKIDANDEKLMELIGASTGAIARFAPDMELAPMNEAEPLIDVQIRLLKQLAEIPGTPGELAAIARAETAENELGELRGKVETVANYLLEKHPSAIVDINECCLVVAVKVMDDQAAEIAELETDIEQLEGKIEAINGGEGDELPAIAARERPENARDFGPTFGQIDAPEIGQLREEKAGLEIGFSNGEHEIVELAPVPINAADLQAVEGRYIAPTIHVKGGTHREDLHGAALLKDGEQIAYCQFPAPIALEVGQERRFDRAITFG
jgi:hypothetical protein